MYKTDDIVMKPIGRIDTGAQGTVIRLNRGFGKGLKGLDGFSHVVVLWNFDQAVWDGKMLTYQSPYKSYTGELGVFASRGPFRPNGIALSICRMISCDPDTGNLTVDWIEAEPESPVLDLKPFHPSSDVISSPGVPEWCKHWPKSREESAMFDWEQEFSF